MRRPRYRDVTRRHLSLKRLLLPRLHGRPLLRFAMHRLERILAAYYNSDMHIMSNGEDWALRVLAQHYRSAGETPTAFDVGANVGFWTYRLLAHAPEARVHCFEPVAATYQELCANIKGCAQVTAHPFGLSDRAGDLEFHANRKPGQASRYRARTGRDQRIRVRLERGADVLERHGLERLHILKVDAEGMELEVLRGLADLLERGAIDVVQFEWLELGAQAPSLKDILRLLSGAYTIGRLYPRFVRFLDWDAPPPRTARLEHACAGNYIAVARRLPELAARLREGAP